MRMMTVLRRYFAGILVLALVLTGHSMAIARGMPGSAGYAEYCIGETAVMVPVDGQGNPTGPAHICPDFGLSLLDWVAEATITARPVSDAASRIEMWHDVSAHVVRAVTASARAPPVHL
ncbi:hypothetical protein [Shimia sp.]|uniref:hypothetical protein n=1 Tax=Shimia sp. TaxID=1954381 RepID=UPI003297B0A1